MFREFLDVSTGHISQGTATWLADHKRTAIHATDYGWFIWSGLFEDITIPDDLRAVLAYARGKGCDYVMFDRDSDVIDELPLWDW